MRSAVGRAAAAALYSIEEGEEAVSRPAGTALADGKGRRGTSSVGAHGLGESAMLAVVATVYVVGQPIVGLWL